MPVPSPFSMNFNDHQDMPKARSWSFHILSALRKNRNSFLKLAFSMRSLRTSPHQTSPFLCGFFPLENFSLTWKRHPNRWRTYIRHSWPLSSEGSFACHTYCDEQWGFFCVPHLLWHGPFIPVADLLAGELSQPVLTTWVCRDRESNSNLLHSGRTLYQMSNKLFALPPKCGVI